MSNKVRGMPREVVNVLRMNVLHRVPVLWLCLVLLLLALVPSVPAHAGFVGCVLAKRSGDEAVQLKLTTDEDGEVRITIGDNVITFGVKAYKQLDTGLLEISGDVVDLKLFYDDMLADRCTIYVWDIPYHYEGFCCDEIPPVIEAAKQPKPNAKGWNNELVTVSMTAEDEEGGSGIAAIYYIHDGEVIRIGEDALGFAEADRIATYSFDLAEDGTYELEFWAEDNAGNESEHGTLTVKIDKTSPLVELSPSGGTYTGSVTIEWRASDSLSGLENCRVYLNGSLISSTYTGSRTLDPGSYSVKIEATDCAGNLRPYSTQYTVVGSAHFDVIGLQVSPRELVVGATSTISCTIRNTGGKRDSQSIKLYIDGSQRDTRSLTLASGESHVVSFSYTFQYSGSYKVKISSEDDSETASVAVLSLAQLEVSARTRDFGEVDVGSSASRSFTITNRGDSKLEGHIRCNSGDCAAFTFSPSSFSLGKQETARITVWFSPSQERTYRAVIGIESNGGSCTISLTGEGKHELPNELVVPLGVAGTPYEDLEPGVRGGTFYCASIKEPITWNPVTLRGASNRQYTNLMMRGLVSIDPMSGEIVPELAKSWDISDDNLVITFYLRQGLKWSDGMPFTADDVVFSFNDLYYNEDVETNTRDILLLPDGTYPVVEKIDDYTVQVTLSMIFRPILDSMRAVILPQHVLAQYIHSCNPDMPPGTFNEAWGLDTDPSELVGMGPFMLETYIPDEVVTFVRNPYYYHYDPYGVQLPYIERYFVVWVYSQDVTLLKFRTGELDALKTRANDVRILEREATGKDFTLLVSDDTPVFETTVIALNQDVENDKLRVLFRNVQFRQALAHMIDKQVIIENLYYGLAVSQWSPVSYLSPFYAGRDYYDGPVTEADAVVFWYDLEKANALLDEIGIVDRDGDGWRDYEDGTRVEIELITNVENTVHEAMCLVIADAAAQVGLKFDVHLLPSGILADRLLGATYEACVLDLPGDHEPNDGANVYKSTGGLHFWHYSASDEPTDLDQHIDDLLDRGAGTLDLDEAFNYYKEYQILLAKNLNPIYVVSSAFTYAYYNHVGNGQVANPFGTPSGDNGLTVDFIFLK